LILKTYIGVLFLFLTSGVTLFAQDDEIIFEDDTTDSIPKPKHPSKKAMLYSAIVPGGGQIYNHIHLPRTSRRKWNVYWKVPLIYGAIGGSAYMLVTKQREIGLLRKEYTFRVENPTLPISEGKYQNFDNQALLQLHSNSQTQRDLFILTTVLAYAINILDASVEAHFINFDVSDDLSLHIQPAATSNFGIGLGFALRFK
jgi:hypothetical protein